MMLADGELSPSETDELKTFVKGNKELEQEMAYWMATRIVPDAREVFSGKENLLKKAPAGRIVNMRQLWVYGIAAGILFLLFAGLLKWKGNSEVHDTSVVIAKPDTTHVQTQASATPRVTPLVAASPITPVTVHTTKTPLKKIVAHAPVKKLLPEEQKENTTNNMATVEKPKTDAAQIAVKQEMPTKQETVVQKQDDKNEESIQHVEQPLVKTEPDNVEKPGRSILSRLSAFSYTISMRQKFSTVSCTLSKV